MKNDSDIAIQVSNLSKKFNIYNRPADMLYEILTRKPRSREFWALKDITFDVKRGEVVGVIKLDAHLTVLGDAHNVLCSVHGKAAEEEAAAPVAEAAAATPEPAVVGAKGKKEEKK